MPVVAIAGTPRRSSISAIWGAVMPYPSSPGPESATDPVASPLEIASSAISSSFAWIPNSLSTIDTDSGPQNPDSVPM